RARRGSMAYLDLLHGARRRSLVKRLWQTYWHLIQFGYLLVDRALMLAEVRMGFERPVHIVMYQEPGDAQERFHAEYRRLLAGMDIISTTDPLGAGLAIM